jgi:hypothetical protein
MNSNLIVFGTIGFIALCFVLSYGGVAMMNGGTFARRQARRLKDPVDGVLQVVAASSPPFNASASNYTLTGVIQAPGVPATSVTHSGMAALSKWPQPGARLPVTVSRSQPNRFVIRWDEISDSSQQASQLAEQLAQSLRTAGGAGQPTASSLGTPTSIVSDPGDLMQKLEASGLAMTFPTADQTGAAPTDAVDQLSKLADLRDRGILTPAEFEAQKQKLLGQ